MIAVDEREALNSTRTELVDALRSIVGLRVTSDPRNINPPCCLVGIPRITQVAMIAARGKLTVDVEIPVTLIGAGPSNDDAVKWLLEYVFPVMFATNARTGEPGPAVDVDGGPLPPSYVMTVFKSLHIEEDGS